MALLVDHCHSATAAFPVEHQLAAPRAWQQLRQPLRWSEDAGNKGCTANQQHHGPHALVHSVAAPGRDGPDRRRHACESNQGTHQPKFRHQDKPCEHDANDPAQGIEGNHCPNVPPHPAAVHGQSQCQGECRTE
ncbi:hypothetical protein D3C80_1679300 [compost metagenome]